ncbi:MAG TPA: hypothetical protein PKK47_10355, partial [Smithellaceae bacterium]|nr:hypothetical protein [Smithellaceae bacterium]
VIYTKKKLLCPEKNIRILHIQMFKTAAWQILLLFLRCCTRDGCSLRQSSRLWESPEKNIF